jgi:3-oxoacyl-[acyl-carrier protein] reductase
VAECSRRVAVVTGAAQGIGQAIAARYLADGYRVAFADVNEELNERAAAADDPTGERATVVRLDVRELGSIEACLSATVERWGGVDVWVNNAARTATAAFLEVDPADWDDVLATNLRGTYFGCRVAGRYMCERGSGRIVNLASLAGQWGRSLTGVHYAASKAGIVAVTRVAATTFAPYGVTVNAIAPAAIEGPQASAMPAETLEAYAKQIPVGRLGKPEEVAALAAYLASEEAAYTTGATFDVNGGMLMR